MESTVSCAFTECTEETYLPHTCSQCGKKFCDKHESQEAHKCPFANVSKLRTTVCPLCNEVLRVEAGESLDHAVNTHLDTGKCSTAQKNVPHQQTAASFLFGSDHQNQQQNSSSSSKNNFCSLQSCNQYEPVPVVCSHCHKSFCLKHKLPEHHNCSKLASISKSAAQQQRMNNNNQNQIVNGQILSTSSSSTNSRKLEKVLFTCSNSADSAIGIRPGRNITQGDILVMCLYDAGKLKRPNLKPVLFSVSPLTPIGRLLDAAVDHYPGLSKTAKYSIFSSVALSQQQNQQGKMMTKRHFISNQGLNVGDAFAEAAATGSAFPPGSMNNFYSPVDNRVILAFCISIEDNNNSNNHSAVGGNETGMIRSETDKVLMSATVVGGDHQQDSSSSPLETQACWVHAFKDAKGTILPILVDKEKIAKNISNNNNQKSAGNNKKKEDDKCLVQ